FIAATIAVSFLALLFAVLIGVGAALFLASVDSHLVRSFAYPFIDLLAGVPSVVYGFVGLLVVVRLFMGAGVTSGLCVLGASLVLAVMLLVYCLCHFSRSGRALPNKTRIWDKGRVMGGGRLFLHGVRLFTEGWRLRTAAGHEFGRMAPGALSRTRLWLQ
ncbi:MAG: hypothetical protein IJG88_01975, partial [Eggerthellaceae bacterium]|nr:hypothetical protein [Eggerthellaceae bacterium]